MWRQNGLLRCVCPDLSACLSGPPPPPDMLQRSRSGARRCRREESPVCQWEWKIGSSALARPQPVPLIEIFQLAVPPATGLRSRWKFTT